MPKNHIKVPSKNIEHADLVEIKHNKPMVSSLVIAELFGRRHDSVLRSIRQVVIEQLGVHVFAETYKDNQGKERPLYWLEERAALIVMPFLGGKKAMDGQMKLVDAYLAYHRAAEQKKDPDWKVIRDETKVGFKWMADTLKERREASGKATKSFHYSNEARLVNSVLSGRFEGLNRDALSASDLKLVGDLQRYNATLIAQDIPYQKRKEILRDRATLKLSH
jgi:Rha family phage regulatory protein